MRSTAAVVALLGLCGCGTLVNSATSRLAGDLSTAVLNQGDVQTARDGLPAFLLLIDGLIESQPESSQLLLAGARLYGAYASAFAVDQARAQRLSERARGYGLRALCVEARALCERVAEPYEVFAVELAQTRRGDVDALYGFGAAWAVWVQARSDDWSAVAELPKIQALMERVVALDEAHDRGTAHAYLGVLASQRPATLGGQPELGRQHFERAVVLSEGRNLMIKVLYARSYARLVFDRPLHDRLLGEVLAADPETPGLVLTNTLARQEASELLAGADDYF